MHNTNLFILVLMLVQCIHGLINDIANFNEEVVQSFCNTQMDCNKFGDDIPCLDGECQCVDSHCSVAIYDVRVTVLGETCATTEQCYIEGAFCNENKVCSCPSHTIPARSGRKCLNATQDLNDECEEEQQCKTYNKFGVCKNSICVCQSGTHSSRGTCYISSGLGGRCSRKEECDHLNNTQCNYGICGCIQNFVPDSKTSICLPVRTYEDSCEDDTQCRASAGQGAECSKNICSCKELFQYSVKLKRCIRDHRLGEECSEHFDCHQPGQELSRLMCVEGNCKCRLQYFEEDGYCVLKGTFLLADFKLIMLVLVALYVYQL